MTYIPAHIYITDQNHGYADPETPIGKQWPVNEPVTVGAGSWIGTGAVILPGARIGRNVVVAAGSVVRGEVPDHCVVAGVPGRVVRRLDADGQWRSARAVGEALCRCATAAGSAAQPASMLGDLAQVATSLDALAQVMPSAEAAAEGAVLGAEPPAVG